MLDQLRRHPAAGPGPETTAAEASPRTATPRHLAIIMDGNGRWAQERGLPRVAGHRAGVEALRRVVKICPELGIEYLTVYAFSTENWKRPKEEVDALLSLLVEYCKREINELAKNGVRVRVLGRLHELPISQRRALERAVAQTDGNHRLQLNMAFNYGSHSELVDAVRDIAREVQAGRITPEAIDDHCISDRLYTAGMPDPDLIIRTAGEMRLSNFLLWQAAYAEIWVTPAYWPDFGREHLEQALHEYGHRERRFGAIRPVHGG